MENFITYVNIGEETIKNYEWATGYTISDKRGDLVPVETLVGMVEDLLAEVDRLNEEAQDREEDIETYYKPRSAYELTGMREEDF